jgi:YVTN family beta-propeller protein
MRDSRVFVIDVAARKVVQVIDAGARAANRLRFTPDGKRVLVSEIGGGDLIVLEAASRTVVRRIPLGRGASGILIPPDGSRAFVAMTGEDAIAVVDLKTLTETTRLKTGRGPDGMAWLPAR